MSVKKIVHCKSNTKDTSLNLRVPEQYNISANTTYQGSGNDYWPLKLDVKPDFLNVTKFTQASFQIKKKKTFPPLIA